MLVRAALTCLAVTLASLAATGAADAQIPPEDRTDGNGNTYLVTDSTETGGPTPNTPPLTGGTVLTLRNDVGVIDGDDGEANITVPFAFAYHGTDYPANTVLRVGANGAVLINAAAGNVRATNEDLSSTDHLPIIAPFWDDLEPRVCGDVRFGTAGVSPDRVHVIEWDNVCDYSSTTDNGGADGYSFQIRLHETTNVIEFHYADSVATQGNDNSDNGRSATIGLGGGPNDTGQNNPYIQYAFNAASPNFALPSFPNSEFAIRFTPCKSNQLVDTVEELDFAIECYNAQTPAGDHTITLTANITHPNTIRTIDSSTDAGKLTITGLHNGTVHTLAGPGIGAINHLTPLLTIDNPGNAATDLQSIAIRNGDGTTVLIEAGDVSVTQATIDGASSSLVAVDADLTISESTIGEASVNALVAHNSTVVASQSTILRGGFGAIFIADNSTLLLTNSTTDAITNDATSSTYLVNSTALDEIENFGFMASNSSLLLGECTENPLTIGAGTFALDTDSCMNATPLFSSSLAPPLANHGGETNTLKLLPSSNAAGAGDCSGVIVDLDDGGLPLTGTIDIDQRGEPRPAGSCDAGAFETNAAPCGTDFTDVPAGAFYEQATIWASCLNITTGTTATTFSPGSTLTRGQMATFLWRHAGEPAPANPNHGFEDVPAGAFYDLPVAWLLEQHITTGTNATTFSPNARVTRAQMAAFLHRYAGTPSPSTSSATHSFEDVPSDAYYDRAVTWMVDSGITTGTTATTYSPGTPLTRGQAVTFLLRYTLSRGFS